VFLQLLAVAGPPYDTLEEVIGIRGSPSVGSLKDFAISVWSTKKFRCANVPLHRYLVSRIFFEQRDSVCCIVLWMG
jgi:hypothetical protein